jgi:hypothetical protein
MYSYYVMQKISMNDLEVSLAQGLLLFRYLNHQDFVTSYPMTLENHSDNVAEFGGKTT